MFPVFPYATPTFPMLLSAKERCSGAHFAVVEWQIFGTQDKCKGKLLPESNDRNSASG